MLANALRASPSLGEALASSVELVSAPLSQELDLTVKAMHLGTPLQAALRQMVQRIGSRSVGAAITTLQVAQRTGGNLPQTLETAAAALREMARLEGVVRTKTAEGRSQLMVLAAIPFGLGAAIYAISPESLAPLWTTPAGYLLLAIATALWLGALLLARKILAVDI
ncbi:MAG: type II secretion system F family protein [Polyangiales bacterium]